MRLTLSLALLGSLAAMGVVVDLSQACSCAAPGTPLEELEKSEVVFTGRVIGVELVEVSPGLFNEAITFLAFASWKGPVTRTFVVHTDPDEGMCGVAFQESAEYLVYAFDWSFAAPYTYNCSRTTLLAGAQEDLEALGEPEVVAVSGASWGALKARYEGDE